MLMEELIDIYDADRNRIGKTIPREGAFLKEGEFMLYVLAIVENAQGKYLITQRSLDKHWAAGWWEVTGGGVLAGETPDQAVVREVREEVGLDVSAQPLEIIYSYCNVDLERGDNYFVDIYRFTLDGGDFSLVASKNLLVRALAMELGASVESLRRTRVGKFSVERAIPFDRLLELDARDLPSVVTPLSEALAK